MRIFLTCSVIALFLSACGSSQPSSQELAATTQALAATTIAFEQATPTNTPLPSDTPTSTQTPTATSQPSASPTLVPTFLPTWTVFGQLQSTQLASARTNKDDNNAPLLLKNNTEEHIHFILLTPLYQEYEFNGDLLLIVPQGTYTYRVWVGKNGPFSGSFSITNGDKHILTFYEDRVHFATP